MIVPSNPNVSQPPIATPFQPGGTNERTGTTEQTPRENTPQPAGAASAETQETQPDRNREIEAAPRNDNPVENEREASNGTRGSILDIEA